MKKRTNDSIDTGLGNNALEKPPSNFKCDRDIARWVQRTMRKLEPACDDDPNFQLACFVLASSIVGPHEDRILRMLEVRPLQAALWARNLRRGGIWQESAVRCQNWYDEQSGFTAFITALLVAEGLVESRVDDAGELQYRPVTGAEWWQNN
jgi:hypothetical protein